MRLKIAVFVVLMVVNTMNTANIHAQTETPTARAIPFKGITIDDKLDDWPEGLERYLILNHKQIYGPTDMTTLI